jgi:flagellar hook protein FlgE
MGTALFTAVTGLSTHQRRLDVIANNVANVNTTGYRSSRVFFQDQFSQTLEGAQAASDTFGGTNPTQVGLGVTIASIDNIFTQGSLVSTGVASDLAIQGSGFFILSDGVGEYYSRDGSFSLNVNGQLIDSATGMIVQGYLADSTGAIDPNSLVQDIVIPVGATSIVTATEEVVLNGNLNSDAAAGDTVTRTVRTYDSLGTARDIVVTFTNTANPDEWTWTASSTDTEISAITGTGTIAFDTNGGVSSVTSTTVSVDFDNTIVGLPTDPFEFDIDFTNVTHLASASDVAVQSQDGYPRGVLESFNFSENGQVNGVYTNGTTRVLGQIALASFANNGGLVREGNNLFRDSPSSGLAQVGFPSTGGRGSVSGGVLEGSNVDLATEFSNLIITQRGYQANARTITAADTMLQETVNLVR